ncbi:hypothetical protein HK099_004896 [Clydaea vesicula]|uniref:Trafficking protein particle complex subunit 11 domain-containing protein n=1 Tax=Clydaea vesicula TaxID=447962 RepID=A0AAD5XZY5_9FUNG|nr:hypothetical protein HK099_004896 [Clydaea vesicula]
MDQYPAEHLLNHIPLMATIGLKDPSPNQESVEAVNYLTTVKEALLNSTQNSHLSHNSQIVFHLNNFEKSHVFPRKNQNHEHSTLSPLTPSSPLYPDGLISTLWLIKHRELSPSVVVGFFDLFEKDGLSAEMERERDIILCSDINERRRAITDRGIKFAVVLILKFNSVGWNTRYEFKLGVLAEFRQEFDTSVKHYETAYQILLEILSNSVATSTIGGGTSYSSSGEFLNVNSTRWEEAKGLLDCLNYKICKLYFYIHTPISALSQFQKHLTNVKVLPEFSTISTGKTFLPEVQNLARKFVGGGSIECWAWLGKQFRLFGELVEHATNKLNLKLPYPPPGSVAGQATAIMNTLSGSAGAHSITGGELSTNVFGPFSSTNTSLVLQHAGFYYIASARCAEERWHKSREAENTSSLISPPPAARSSQVGRNEFDVQSARVTAEVKTLYFEPADIEKNVEHSVLVIELLTKAYEQFKFRKCGRTSLYLAGEIARLYYLGGKFDMALKFFDRINKTYRKDRWFYILKHILRETILCASKLGVFNVVIESLLELLGLGEDVVDELLFLLDGKDLNERQLLQKNGIEKLPSMDSSMDLFTPVQGREKVYFNSFDPENTSVEIDMNTINSFVDCSFQFKYPECVAGESMEYQVNFWARKGIEFTSALKFSKLLIKFSESDYDVEISSNIDDVDTNDQSKSDINFYNMCKNANNEKNFQVRSLYFQSGQKYTFQGLIKPKDSMLELKFTEAKAILQNSLKSREIILNFRVKDHINDNEKKLRTWITKDNNEIVKKLVLPGIGEVSALQINQRQPKVNIVLKHCTPAYIEEVHPVSVFVTNEENEEIDVFLDAEFKGVTSEGNDNSCFISSNYNSSKNFTKEDKAVNFVGGINLGTILPGKTSEKVLYTYIKLNPAEKCFKAKIHYNFTKKCRDLISSEEENNNYTGFIEKNFSFKKEEVLKMEFCIPFEYNFQFFSQTCNSFGTTKDNNGRVINELGLFTIEEDFFSEENATLEKSGLFLYFEKIISISVKCLGPWDVVFKEVYLTSANMAGVEVIPITPQEPSALIENQTHQSHSFLYRVKIKKHVEDENKNFLAGTLNIIWRRKPTSFDNLKNDEMYGTSSIAIPPINIGSDPVNIVVDLPAQINQGSLTSIIYLIQNTTMHVMELQTLMESNEGFIYSGLKQSLHKVLPFSTVYLSYNLVAINSGKLILPKLTCTRKSYSNDLSKAEDIPCPIKFNSQDISIFVKPVINWN